MNNDRDDKIKKLIEAFNKDNFQLDKDHDVFLYNGRIGIRAHHNDVVNTLTGEKKKAFYVEGQPHEMGYLLGMMAEPDINTMCTEFNKNIVLDFINLKIKEKWLRELIGSFIEDVVAELTKRIQPDIPDSFKQELQGLCDGCKYINPGTKVTEKDLWVLNVGIDAILAFVYTGIHPVKVPTFLKPDFFRIPLACNGFSVSGENPQTGDTYHFMGRDFMFPTAGVFQDVACMIIYNPDEGNPFVCMSAPGMMGSIAGLNKFGVGIGVDMAPSGNCNPYSPGINSLLLARYCIENGKNIDDAVQIMIDSKRGVTWMYIFADGQNQKSCIVEAGAYMDDIDFLAYPPDFMKKGGFLPDTDFLKNNPSVHFQKGLGVRWNNFKYPDKYFNFNNNLFKLFEKKYNKEEFAERGYIEDQTKKWEGKNCPLGYYFAPQRESRDNLLLVTNMFILPELRLCAMDLWTNFVAEDHYDDVQWRYDELNNELLSALDNKNYIDYDKAREIIDFLNPNGKFKTYYDNPHNNPDGKPVSQLQINGSVSLMDLVNTSIESHYGYYGDKWIKIRLKNYPV